MMEITKQQTIKKNNIAVEIFKPSEEGAKYTAGIIAKLIREKAKKEERCILGLATGSTPEPVYKELIRLHKDEGLSFRNVITFNLDEYFPIKPENNQSYYYFMHQQLFDHVDIPKENIHVPNGNIRKEEVADYCKQYERLIEDFGGIDMQILGIGHNGHIGFNEPGSDEHSSMRLIELTQATREANARNFKDISEVPASAITMGIRTILKAKKIALLAWGAGKADAVQKSLEEAPTKEVPASLLQLHSQCIFVLDQQSSKNLHLSLK